MLGAVVVVGGIMEPEKFLEDMKESFAHKFKTKPEVIEGNMKAIERAMQEVQGL
jgi:pyruvate ferredoxin oxidoreductase gamma subunit